MDHKELLQKAVKRVESIVPQGFQEKDALHVAHSGTQNYLIHTGVTMSTIVMSNQKDIFSFHLFVNGLEDDDRRRFEELAEQWKCKITFYFINDDVFKDMLHEDGIAAFFYRFIIPLALAGEGIRRVLYTDGDVMCQGALRPLLETDLKGNIAACVRDFNDEWAKEWSRKVGTKQYFNSGMMMIDTDAWNKKKISERACEMAIERRKKPGHLHTHDQNILNILLNDDVLLVDSKYNVIYNTSMKSFFRKQDDLSYPSNSVLVHFTGVVKPWRSWVKELPAVARYWKYWHESPWKDVPPVGPKNHKDCHQAARNARRFGHYSEMMHWYKEYVLGKYIRHT